MAKDYLEYPSAVDVRILGNDVLLFPGLSVCATNWSVPLVVAFVPVVVVAAAAASVVFVGVGVGVDIGIGVGVGIAVVKEERERRKQKSLKGIPRQEIETTG